MKIALRTFTVCFTVSLAGSSTVATASAQSTTQDARKVSMTTNELAAAVGEGRWTELAATTPTTTVGFFCKGIANGVIGEWRVMEEVNRKVKTGDAEVDAFCDDLVAASPKNAFAHFVNATRYNDDSEKAIKEYTKTVELAPDFAPAYYQIGVLSGKKGNYAEQSAWMDRAIKADPQYAPAYVARGHSYKETGRLAAAIDEFKKAVQVLESNKIRSGDQLGRALYNWGWILVNQPSPDNDQAIVVLTRAIKADPLRVEAYNELGIAYKRKGLFSDAIAAYKDGIKHGDNTATIYFNLGVSEYRSGNSANAKSAFERAIALDPGGSTGGTARQWLSRIR